MWQGGDLFSVLTTLKQSLNQSTDIKASCMHGTHKTWNDLTIYTPLTQLPVFDSWKYTWAVAFDQMTMSWAAPAAYIEMFPQSIAINIQWADLQIHIITTSLTHDCSCRVCGMLTNRTECIFSFCSLTVAEVHTLSRGRRKRNGFSHLFFPLYQNKHSAHIFNFLYPASYAAHMSCPCFNGCKFTLEAAPL